MAAGRRDPSLQGSAWPALSFQNTVALDATLAEWLIGRPKLRASGVDWMVGLGNDGRFVAAVEAIYGAALAPATWPEALHRIAGVSAAVVAATTDEAFVDLQRVEWQIFQQRQGGIACAEIIDMNADAVPLQQIKGPPRDLEVL